MAARNRNTSVRSYRFYRHNGGLSPNGQIILTTTYATFDPNQPGRVPGQSLIFFDDVFQAQGEQWPTSEVDELKGFVPTGMQFINDSPNSIFFSADGIWDLFELKTTENILFDWYRERQIFLRGAVGGENFRLVVW